MLMSMAAKEKTSSRWSAWLAPILFLLAAVAAAGPASALTCGALQTRTWEKTSTPLDSRLDESLQLLNLHQQNGGAGYDDALGSPLAAENTVTVTHFTSAEGADAITNGGSVLNPGSYVTNPGEVAGMNASQVESTLEIDAGKGAFSSTFQTPASNLTTPANGAFTSGGATQFQLINPTPVGPFVPTPP
jgi:hypothetical protein